MAIYVDTGAWIALHESRDVHHDEARRQLAAIREDGELLVTGWHTVVEFVDGLCHHYDQARAVKQLDRLRESPSVRRGRGEPPHRGEASCRTDLGGGSISPMPSPSP